MAEDGAPTVAAGSADRGVPAGAGWSRGDLMSVLGSPGPERSRSGRRSVRFTFTMMVAAPVTCLVLLWGLAVAVVLREGTPDRDFLLRGHGDLGEVTLFAGGGLFIVLVSAILIGLFARRLARDIQGLEATARHLAGEQMPQLLE